MTSDTNKHGLLQDTMDLLLNDITSFSNIVLERVQGQIIAKLQAAKADAGTIQEVKGIFSASEVVSPFKELDTEYKQMKYFRRNFGLVVSRSHYYCVQCYNVPTTSLSYQNWTLPTQLRPL